MICRCVMLVCFVAELFMIVLCQSVLVEHLKETLNIEIRRLEGIICCLDFDDCGVCDFVVLYDWEIMISVHQCCLGGQDLCSCEGFCHVCNRHISSWVLVVLQRRAPFVWIGLTRQALCIPPVIVAEDKQNNTWCCFVGAQQLMISQQWAPLRGSHRVPQSLVGCCLVGLGRVDLAVSVHPECGRGRTRTKS